MNIVVFGASGRMGQHIVEQALAAGHQVTAFVRNPSKITLQHPNLTLMQGDVLDTAQVEKAVSGKDAVISALGPTRPPVPNLMRTAAENITNAMKKQGVRRLIVTAGAGVRDERDRPKFIDTVFVGLLKLVAGEVLRDSAAGVRLIQATDLDWTVARFPRLTDGPPTGNYRVGYVGKDSGVQISRADAADFILKELKQGEYLRKLPMVSS